MNCTTHGSCEIQGCPGGHQAFLAAIQRQHCPAHVLLGCIEYLPICTCSFAHALELSTAEADASDSRPMQHCCSTQAVLTHRANSTEHGAKWQYLLAVQYTVVFVGSEKDRDAWHTEAARLRHMQTMTVAVTLPHRLCLSAVRREGPGKSAEEDDEASEAPAQKCRFPCCMQMSSETIGNP